METNAPSRFTLCNNDQCCNKFNFIDVATVHSVVDGPDPRDHCANERNLLTWLRTGMVLALIDDPASIQVQVVSYIFVALGLASICVGVMIYLRNMNQILERRIAVGHGWTGYTMVLLIVLFVLFVMAAALTI
ncbi:hypothetical protein BDB00DRAFT_286712 [Zychaea mexicana]|uniref:uncharacterized protein n=1 Tax=Zychaea mexicana TaxID=64656 RepID=UPI0022FF235D|nr:uncharacterized protein BDB00DRAFT_286712 [Zychaea mexicana]KAI9494740.1 hypothetical protein BDB00DRAFT_286712 [Zychaea mexicana]